MPPTFPPPGPYGNPGSPRQTNGMAITSLVMGLCLCIPVVTGLGGIIFGVIGLKKTKDPRIGGKGLAIAGLVLGIVNILGWGVSSGIGLAAYNATAEHRAIAKNFVKDLSEGNVTAAAAVCDSKTISKSSLEKSSQAMKAWETLTDTTTFGFSADSAGQGTQVVVSGAAAFSKAQKSFIIQFAKEGDKWKIVKFEFP